MKLPRRARGKRYGLATCQNEGCAGRDLSQISSRREARAWALVRAPSAPVEPRRARERGPRAPDERGRRRHDAARARAGLPARDLHPALHDDRRVLGPDVRARIAQRVSAAARGRGARPPARGAACACCAAACGRCCGGARASIGTRGSADARGPSPSREKPAASALAGEADAPPPPRPALLVSPLAQVARAFIAAQDRPPTCSTIGSRSRALCGARARSRRRETILSWRRARRGPRAVRPSALVPVRVSRAGVARADARTCTTRARAATARGAAGTTAGSPHSLRQVFECVRVPHQLGFCDARAARHHVSSTRPCARSSRRRREAQRERGRARGPTAS